MTTLFLLLFIYQLKHFICDYPLQNEFMLGKFKKFPDFIIPLLAHAGVHGLATFLISLFFVSPLVALGLGLFDLVVHFVVDRIKADPKLLGRFKSLTSEDYLYLQSQQPVTQSAAKRLKSNKYFWFSLGADQALHHLTHYVIIYFLL